MSDEEEKEQEEELYLPLSFSLPAAGSIHNCPKCGVELVGSLRIYHEYGYVGQPCEKIYGYPTVGDLGEHLCRQCYECGHMWVEAVTGKKEE